MTEPSLEVTEGGLEDEEHWIQTEDSDGNPTALVMRIHFGPWGRSEWPRAVELEDQDGHRVRLTYEAMGQFREKWLAAVDRAYYAATEGYNPATGGSRSPTLKEESITTTEEDEP